MLLSRLLQQRLLRTKQAANLPLHERMETPLLDSGRSPIHLHNDQPNLIPWSCFLAPELKP